MSATASATATKTEMDSLLTQIEHHADSASGSARQFLARILLTMFLIVAVLLFVCLIALWVWFGWETGSWPDPFYVIIVTFFTATLLLGSGGALIVAIAAPRLVTSRDRDRVLRIAATVGDERLTPLAEPQPTPLPAAELADAATQLGPIPLATAARWSVAQVVVYPIALLCFLTGELLTSAPITTLWPWLGFGSPFSVAVELLTAIGVLGMLTGLFLQAFPRGAPLKRVTVDTHGVRWQASWLAGWRSIAWDQARTFACVTYTYEIVSSTSLERKRTETVYLIEAPGTALLWAVPMQKRTPTYRPTPARKSAAAREAAQTLVRLVATRTGLPLRDLSALAVDLSHRKADPVRVVATRYTDTDGGADAPAALQEALQPKRIPYLGISFLLLISLALSAALGAGFYLHQRQPIYFGSLPQRVAALTPTYTLGQQSLMVGSPGVAASYTPGTYGDVAASVTLTQNANMSGWAGLAVHATLDGSDGVVFLLNPGGAWQFARVTLNANDYFSANGIHYPRMEGISPAINSGLGARNQLLVITRASLYLFYVNGALVFSYPDSYSYLPITGAIGFYVSGRTTSAQFGALAIYPTKPITSFQYV